MCLSDLKAKCYWAERGRKMRMPWRSAHFIAGALARWLLAVRISSLDCFLSVILCHIIADAHSQRVCGSMATATPTSLARFASVRKNRQKDSSIYSANDNFTNASRKPDLNFAAHHVVSTCCKAEPSWVTAVAFRDQSGPPWQKALSCMRDMSTVPSSFQHAGSAAVVRQAFWLFYWFAKKSVRACVCVLAGVMCRWLASCRDN